MSEPLVCAIMLTRDRPQMAKRAVECFRSQTYDPTRRVLFILDTGAEGSFGLSGSDCENECHDWRPSIAKNRTIGELRNYINEWSRKDSILIHWDDDDFSHPNRISEQVALLQASGKQVVGYRDMLFWRRCEERFLPDLQQCDEYEAWLYTNNDPRYCLGTSLCYWRETWEKRPFKAIPAGEDKEFLRDRDTLGVSSLRQYVSVEGQQVDVTTYAHEPRMIASIHSGNHVTYQLTPNNWKRVPEYDDLCRKTMTL